MGQIRYLGYKIVQVITIYGVEYSSCGSIWPTIKEARKAIRNHIKPNK